MDFVGKDLEKYQRALERVNALSLVQYIDPLERIIHELERIRDIDTALLRGDTRNSYFL